MQIIPLPCTTLLNIAIFFLLLQIMWLVGTGQLMPNLDGIRTDTPPPLRRLMLECIRHDREQRPLFPQVLAIVENLMRTLPKIHRSLSEPILHRTTFSHSDELSSGSGGGTASPKTPGGGASGHPSVIV